MKDINIYFYFFKYRIMDVKKKEAAALDMLKNVFMLIKCATNQCEKLFKLAQNDAKLQKLKTEMREESNNEKRNKIIIKINNNKTLIEYNLCLYNKCLSVIKDILKAVLKIIKLYKLNPDPAVIKSTSELIKKKVLNKDEIKELANNYLILITFIKHNNK